MTTSGVGRVSGIVEDMAKNDVFEVHDPAFTPAPYVTRTDYKDIEQNLRRAKKNPGRWCTVGVYDTVKIAYDVKRSCIRRYAEPGLTFKSQTLDGVGKLLAHYDDSHLVTDEDRERKETP